MLGVAFSVEETMEETVENSGCEFPSAVLY